MAALTHVADAPARKGRPRLGLEPGDLLPAVVGHRPLGAHIGAYEALLRDPSLDLGAALDAAFAQLAKGFSDADVRRPRRGR